MSKGQRITIWIICGLSMVLSMVSVFRSEPFNINGLSLLIGMLTLVVTIFMGIQIVNAITLKKA